MTDQYIPLSQWPELAEQLALELVQAQNWPGVEWQLETYDAADRALIWAAIPTESRGYIHNLKAIHNATQAPLSTPKTSAVPQKFSAADRAKSARGRSR
jgi:hypothetical protein